MVLKDTNYQRIDLLSKSVFNYAESNRLGLDFDTCIICGFNRIRLGFNLVCGSYCDSTGRSMDLFNTLVKWSKIPNYDIYKVASLSDPSWIDLTIHRTKLDISRVKRAPRMYRSEKRRKLLILSEELFKLENLKSERL